MIHYTQVVTIRKPVEKVFDFVATHNYENHPRWEAEVVAIRPLTEGPIRVGGRAVMVRKDFGKQRETTHECTELVPDRKVAFRHVDGPMDFEIAFSFEPSPNGTRLRVDVAAQPHGAMRVLSPVFRLRMPRVAARLSNRLREVVEGEAADDGGGSAPGAGD
jgi:uncharacterized protein YndB with AHSA1/START domain